LHLTAPYALEEYLRDDDYLMKNTQVIVRRTAVPSGQTGLLSRMKEAKVLQQAHKAAESSIISHNNVPTAPSAAVTAGMTAEEAERMKLRQLVSSTEYM
jgi:hypothetical protein